MILYTQDLPALTRDQLLNFDLETMSTLIDLCGSSEDLARLKSRMISSKNMIQHLQERLVSDSSQVKTEKTDADIGAVSTPERVDSYRDNVSKLVEEQESLQDAILKSETGDMLKQLEQMLKMSSTVP